MEAALLTLEMYFVISLLFSLNKYKRNDPARNLGLFSYKDVKNSPDVKLSKKEKNNA